MITTNQNLSFNGKLQVTSEVAKLREFQEARKSLAPIIEQYDVFIKTVTEPDKRNPKTNVQKYFVEVGVEGIPVKGSCKNNDLSTKGLMTTVNIAIEKLHEKMPLLSDLQKASQEIMGTFDALFGHLSGNKKTKF